MALPGILGRLIGKRGPAEPIVVPVAIAFSPERHPLIASGEWKELSWPKLKSLAANLSDDDAPVTTKADAIARIEAVIAAAQ